MTSPLDGKTSFFVGSVAVCSDVILAPMDGFSDPPFRTLCREHGSAMSYAPFVHAMEILSRAPRALRALDYTPVERPVVFQLSDNDEQRLLDAAQRVLDFQPDILDLNMGCSVRSVAGRGAGAGLLREPRKVARIIDRLSRALPIPVTAKIRLGWDAQSINYLEVARAIEENGGALIAIHARTRQQRYAGRADWDAIRAVKAAVSIPVLGNGDVQRAQDIDRMRAQTGCDGVMVGRGAIGNPWIFQRRDRDQLPLPEVLSTLRRHARAMAAYYGEAQGVRLFRKHLVHYLEPFAVPTATRAALLDTTSLDVLEHHLAGLEALPASAPRTCQVN